MDESGKKPSFSITEEIDNWVKAISETRFHPNGERFLAIPRVDRRGHFLNLIKTLSDAGYHEEDIRTGAVSTQVVLACWPDYIKALSKQKIRECRAITRKIWEEAIKEYFVRPISIYKKPEKTFTQNPQEITEEQQKTEDENRLKLSYEDAPNPELDLEFLAELKAIGSSLEPENE